MIYPYPVTISVLMAVFNTPFELVKRAIDSVLCQDFQDFEWIIVAPKKIRLPQTNKSRFDLLKELYVFKDAARQIWIRGKAVEDWYKEKVIASHVDQPEFVAKRVDIPAEVGSIISAIRRYESRLSVCSRPGKCFNKCPGSRFCYILHDRNHIIT